ncbi:MAG: arsenic resistance protein [Promethearchaeota archaeon]
MKNNKSNNKTLKNKKKPRLNIFEKYLPLWIAICIATGIMLAIYVPNVAKTIDSLQVQLPNSNSGLSIPIGICLFLMMYPATLNLRVIELKKLGKNPKPIILTIISNWIVAPFIGALLAAIFLRANPVLSVVEREQLTVAVILLSSSPCTAMVLVWGFLADGNQEQNVINTSLNTITIIIGYVPLVKLLTGIQNIPLDWVLLLVTAGIFIGIPLIIGALSKKLLIKYKSEKWFNNVYRPLIGKIAIIALLMILVVLFSLNGEILVTDLKENLLKGKSKLVLVSIPLLLGFLIVVVYNLLITKLAKLPYKNAIITVIIGSSSHFEIAIASAIGIYGVGSIAALGTTMGLFWEVPVMLSLVYLGLYLRKKGFWPKAKKINIEKLSNDSISKND